MAAALGDPDGVLIGDDTGFEKGGSRSAGVQGQYTGTAGIPFGWVTADEACGDNGPLRSYLEGRGIACVLAVACAHVLATPAGGRRADALAAKLPRRAWAAGELR